MKQRVDATKQRVSETYTATKDTVTDQAKMMEKLNGAKDGLVRMGNETFNAPISLTMDSQVLT
jgi:hypothetical protein